MSDDAVSSKAAAPTKGQWQNLGVEPAMAKALTLRGFKTPTPIQRATLPHTLSQPPRDVLGMARTGSGKTLAYLVPMLQRLKTSRSRHANSRAIVLVPTRELALQVLKAGKDISRGMKVHGVEAKRPLSWAMIIGGDPLDKQFGMMSEHPDIIIATPGRLLHVVVEMKYSLADMDTIIYDEADRLFELGFQTQLQEILSRLPTSRQSMLFSATLPSSVAEFVRAGLANPAVIRLDADVKINPDLTTHFFRVSAGDKDAGLMVLLELAGIIPGDGAVASQAIVFVATKHHVEYLVSMLSAAGFSASHVYGSLDQVARQRQLQEFRDRKTSLLVVTDVAARGLDIPIMDHVINYDFPPNARVFIHRVGRTARGGRKGTAWSILDKDDLPYYADLAVNLSATAEPPVLHTLPRQSLDASTEAIQALSASVSDLDDLRAVMKKGDSMYRRSRSKATASGYKTARQLAINEFPLFAGLQNGVGGNDELHRARLLSVIDAFRPASTGISAKPPKSRKPIVNSSSVPVDEVAAIEAATPVSRPEPSGTSKDFRDNAFYLPQGARVDEDKMYSIVEPTSNQLISSSVLDLQSDEGLVSRPQRASQLKWDRKRKRFTQERDQGGEKGKMIKTESGALLPATFDSGRYKEWKSRSRSQVKGGENGRPGSGANELSSANDLRKQRQAKAQRSAKNARPARKKT